jgi:hypothetical protein
MKKIFFALVLTFMSFVSVQAQSTEQVSAQKIEQLQTLHHKIQIETILPLERKQLMLETIRDDISELRMIVDQNRSMSDLYKYEQHASAVHAQFMEEILLLRKERIRELQQKSQPKQKGFWSWF